MSGKHVARLAGRRLLVGCACWAIVGVLVVGAQRASATDADIVNAGGFEPHPPDGMTPIGFTTTHLGDGRLEGQYNPIGFGQVASPGQWLRPVGSGASTANVQSTVFAPGGGTQAVKMDKVGNDLARWAVPVNSQGYPDYPSPQPPEPPQPCICITWDMRVEQSAGDGLTTLGPYFGIEAYDDDANPVATLGSLGVDSSNGKVQYQAAGTGDLTDTGATVAFGAWNTFQVKLDYSTHDYTIYLNGTNLGTIKFVDDALYPGQLNQLSDVDISGLPAAGDAVSLALTGTAYFDNFLVREGMCPPPGSGIPEPSTLLMIGVGAAVTTMAVRRRKRASA